MRWLEALATFSGVAACVGALFSGDGNSHELSDGLLRMRSLVEAEDFDAALAQGQTLLAPNRFSTWRREKELDEAPIIVPLLNFADPVLDLYRISGTTREERAHIHFALGVAQLAASDPEKALREFGDARARAGAGELREDAAYNLGTIHLLVGETWRAQIPELGGQPPTPPAAAPPAPGNAPGQATPADQEPPDPLEQARAAYLTALEHYIGRLRLDWQDGDTRANTELVLRRLRELEQIEQEREKQQQEQQDQQQQEQDENQEKQDPKDPSENQDKQDQQQDPQQEPGDEKPEEEPQPEEGKQEPQDPEEQEAQEGEETPKPEPQEVFLTKEEMQRILDRLKEHEEQGEEWRDRARAKRQRPTARDW